MLKSQNDTQLILSDSGSLSHHWQTITSTTTELQPESRSIRTEIHPKGHHLYAMTNPVIKIPEAGSCQNGRQHCTCMYDSSIAANPSGFPGIFLILTLSLDFLISAIIFCFKKNWHPKRKKGWKRCKQSNSQSKFSKPDVCSFLVHAQNVALLAGEVSICWHHQRLTIPAKIEKKNPKVS